MNNFFKKIVNSYLYKQSFIALFIKTLAALFAFLFNILLARKLGAEDTGIFFLCFTIIMISVVIGRLGLDNVVLREVAKYAINNKWRELKGVFLSSMKIAVVSSTLMTVLILFSADLVADMLFNMPEMSESLRMMSLIIIPFSLIFIISSSLKGLKKITQATFIESFFIPFFSVFCLFFLLQDNELNKFLRYYIFIFFFTLILAFYFWYKNTAFIGKQINILSFKNIIKSSMPLLWVASMLFINSWADRIFLGIYSNPESVGVYSISMKIAMLVSFVLVAVNSSSSAKFAEFYQSNNIMALSNYSVKATNIMAVISFPILIFLIIFSEEILHVFGFDFISGAMALIILCVGQFINVATGSVGQILVMTNREKLLRKSIIIGMLTNLFLNFLLVPKYGINGAAIATSFSWTISNVVAFYYVKKELRFNAFVMGNYIN